MTQSVQSEPWIYGVSRFLFGSLAHVVSAVFTVFVAVLSNPGSSLFSWHPFLMTLAFSFFMTEAVLLFSPHSSPVRKLSHKTKGRLHWVLQCLCVTCACLGFSAISYNKHLNGKPHFTSWHGLLGLVTVVIVGLQSLAALPLIYIKLAKGWSLAKLKRYHAVTGLLTYLLGSGSLLLGLWSAWFTGTVNGHLWYLAVLCPSLSALVVMSQVTNAYLARKQMKS
ncbi:transmembrane reductase CYB561D2 isoform X1 [Sardina pilchardus]|uniref:transmembrane reductase CYB561D2 isoform X1 n=2 Tax=Sardina pilchardus TaxID=27697 RepID=UPI002E0D32FA